MQLFMIIMVLKIDKLTIKNEADATEIVDCCKSESFIVTLYRKDQT